MATRWCFPARIRTRRRPMRLRCGSCRYFEANPVKLSKAEDQALKNMETGEVGPPIVDLRRVMCRIGQKCACGQQSFRKRFKHR